MALSKFTPEREWGPFSSPLEKVTASYETRSVLVIIENYKLANRKVTMVEKGVQKWEKSSYWVMLVKMGEKATWSKQAIVGVTWNMCISMFPTDTNLWDLETRNENFLNHRLFVNYFEHPLYPYLLLLIKCLLL